MDVSYKIAQEKDVMSTLGRISTFVAGLVTSIATKSVKYYGTGLVSYEPLCLQKNQLDFQAFFMLQTIIVARRKCGNFKIVCLGTRSVSLEKILRLMKVVSH